MGALLLKRGVAEGPRPIMVDVELVARLPVRDRGVKKSARTIGFSDLFSRFDTSKRSVSRFFSRKPVVSYVT